MCNHGDFTYPMTFVAHLSYLSPFLRDESGLGRFYYRENDWSVHSTLIKKWLRNVCEDPYCRNLRHISSSSSRIRSRFGTQSHAGQQLNYLTEILRNATWVCGCIGSVGEGSFVVGSVGVGAFVIGSVGVGPFVIELNQISPFSRKAMFN